MRETKMTEMKEVELETNNNKTDDIGNEDNVITIELSQDIYSMIALLVQHNKYSQLTHCNQIGILVLVLFSAFTQLSVLITLVVGFTETDQYQFRTDNVILCYNDNNYACDNETSFFEGVMYQYKGVQAPASKLFTFSDYIIRISSYCVLLAYISQSLASLVDFIVITKRMRYWVIPVFSIMITLQLTIAVLTGFIAGTLIVNQTDLIDIITVGIGLVILLEVDDYLYKSLLSSSKYINEDLFIYKLNIKDTIYETYTSLSVKILITMCILIGSLLIIIARTAYYNHAFREADAEGKYEFLGRYAPIFVFVPICMICPLCILLWNSCKRKNCFCC